MYFHINIVLISFFLQVFSQQNGARTARKVSSVRGVHSNNSLWTYFSRPVLNTGLVTLNTKEVTKHRMPTLAEVSDLFETFYACLETYHLALQEDDLKKVFMKILEVVMDIGIDLNNKKKLNTFLQIRISTYTKSLDNLILDSALNKRYNPIVTDLVKRKLHKTQMFKTEEVTKVPTSLYPTKSLGPSKSKQRKVRWKPERTPNSPTNEENDDSANKQHSLILESPLKTILKKDQGMNAENLHKLPNKLFDHLGHLSSSPFLLDVKDFAASSLESPFLVKNIITPVLSLETKEIFKESDIYPHGLVTRKTVHSIAPVDNSYNRFISII